MSLVLSSCSIFSSLDGTGQKFETQIVTTPIEIMASLPPEWTKTPTGSIATEIVEPIDESGDRYYESTGDFSYVPPKYWQISELSGLKYKIIVAPKVNTFTPNINFVDENNSMAIEEYNIESLKTLKKLFPKLLCQNAESFVTAAGAKSLKDDCKNFQNNQWLTQKFYIFDGNGRKIVATYTRSLDTGQENDSIVEDCLKTFRIGR